MKHLLCIVLFIISMTSWASDKVTVTVEPKKPIVNETFNVIFKVNSESAKSIEEINFKYPGLTIVGQSQQGISTKTVYANGKLTVSREITVVYELQANNFGTKFLRDIRVKVDGKELTHPMVSFEVLKEPQVKPEVFVMADVTKTDVFVGEGIVARYYLYSKVSVSNLDVKKYPKLNRFLKRYLQEPDRSERVEVDGELYIRNLIYAAKLFPEKAGQLKIDPLSLSVTYARRNLNDPFGAFTSPRDMRTRTISSDTVNLNVLPLPTPIPSDFTGLVGKHDFFLQTNHSKIVVNQPLDVTLTVSGVGALENFEAPKILQHKSLEEFEANGELKIQDTEMATKTFTYTFLPTAPLELAEEPLSFSYLDPQSGQYVKANLVRKALQVVGQARDVPSKPTKVAADQSSKGTTAPQEITGLKELTDGLSWLKWQNYLNLTLGVTALIILLSFVGLKMKGSLVSNVLVPTHFKKQFNYHDFILWLSPVITKEAKSPKELISELGLSHEAQKYFTDLMNSTEISKFSVNKKEYTYSYNNKFFKELASKIEKYHESHS